MYAYSTTINHMARTVAPKKQKPEHGRKLVARRAELGLSLADIERETNGVVYDQLLWRIENGEKKPSTMKVFQRAALAKVLQWLPTELDTALGLLPSSPDTNYALKHRLENGSELDRFDAAPREWVHFQVMTSASAGTGEAELLDDDEIVSIPLDMLKKRGAQKSDVMVVKVNGDCLVSQNLRTSRRSIGHDDYAFVHMGAAPDQNDIICVWDEQDSQLMLKFYSEQQDPDHPNEIIFYDAKGRHYVRDIAEVKYRGVVFYRSGEL